MEHQPAAPIWPSRIRALASYPFRLGPPGPNDTSTPFGGLAIVHALSSVGDSLVVVALAGSVFVSVSLSAARGRTAIGLIITVLPFAVVGPFIGPVIDRVRGGRRFIVFLTAIGRMAACLMMSAWIHSLLLFPAAFLSLVCSKTYAVTKASLVPGAVDTDKDLVRANARLAVGSSIFTSIAALFGGIVYKLFGSHALLDLDVLVFAATAGLSLHLLSSVREQPRPGSEGPLLAETVAESPTSKQVRRSLAGVLHSIRGGPRPPIPQELKLAQVAMAGMRSVAGFLTALVVFDFRAQHAPVIWYGLVAVASVGGNFGGALLAPVLRDRVSERRLMASAAILIAATAIATTQVSALSRRPAALILAAVVGLGASVAKTAFDATVQRVAPDADRSRLFARFESIFQLVWVVGALIPTLFSIPLLAGFVVVAITVIGTSAVFVVGMARVQPTPARSEPEPPPAPSPPDQPLWPAPAPTPDS
ncbi:MAG TPA: MFS transporter [Acidimicrobiales bacterium]|nr:MFS transporter [Acidimicrobiales bacterium]